ncbi:MAG: ABC transporter permease subunit [Fimbriimonadaceae bacterium]|nr:ABC transporter permease subunit [Fimbriimonadaceae bacterium]
MNVWYKAEERNPMLVETRQATLRMLGIQNLNASARWNVAMVGVVFLGLTALAMRYPGVVMPNILMAMLLVLLNFILPVVLHGVIAKEREKRSIDILLSCPVSPQQIVNGKALRAAPWFLLISGLIMLPLLGSLLARAVIKEPMPDARYGLAGTLLIAFVLLISSSAFFSAITILVSSMVKRAHLALIGTMGIFFLLYFVGPGMMAILNINYGYEIYHPYVAMTLLFEGTTDFLGPWWVILIQTVLTAVCLFMAAKNVSRDYREGDRKINRA